MPHSSRKALRTPAAPLRLRFANSGREQIGQRRLRRTDRGTTVGTGPIAGSVLLLSNSIARFHTWFIKAMASAGFTGGAAAKDVVATRTKRTVSSERRIISAGPPTPSCGDGIDNLSHRMGE